MGKANKAATLTAPVAKTVVKGKKGKPAPVKTVVKGKKGKPAPVVAVPVVAKKKKAKKVDQSIPAAPVKLKKGVDASDAVGFTDTNGVQRNRAKLFGHSVSAVWRWCGYNGWSLAETLELRDAAGLAGITKDANVRCQQYEGTRIARGLPPMYGTVGDNGKCLPDYIPTLDPAAVKRMVKLVPGS